MRRLHSTLLVAALLPFGHWQGAISPPTGDVPIEIDLAKDSKGAPVGAFSGTALKGFPLSHVTVNDAGVAFEIPVSGGGRFEGRLSEDGKSLSGVFTGDEGVAPFSLTKAGEARIEAPPRNARIRADMEGTWNGTLEADGRELRFVLKMSNQPDGTSAASLLDLDEGGFEVPVAISQEGANLTIDVKVSGASWSGALNAAGTELGGTFTQGSVALPMTFRRVPMH